MFAVSIKSFNCVKKLQWFNRNYETVETLETVGIRDFSTVCIVIKMSRRSCKGGKIYHSVRIVERHWGRKT